MKYMVVSVRDVVVNFMYCNEILKKGIAISRFFARSDKAVVFLPDSFQTKNSKTFWAGRGAVDDDQHFQIGRACYRTNHWDIRLINGINSASPPACLN